MSTVTLSQPHCAITSAEKPDGMASQALTQALPAASRALSLFAIWVFPRLQERPHARREARGVNARTPSDLQHRRALQPAGAQIVQRLVRLLQSVRHWACLHRNFRRQRKELLAIARVRLATERTTRSPHRMS